MLKTCVQQPKIIIQTEKKAFRKQLKFNENDPLLRHCASPAPHCGRISYCLLRDACPSPRWALHKCAATATPALRHHKTNTALSICISQLFYFSTMGKYEDKDVSQSNIDIFTFQKLSETSPKPLRKQALRTALWTVLLPCLTSFCHPGEGYIL